MRRSPSVEKIAFVLASAALIWLYGYATHAAEWFPTSILVRAQQQAQAIIEPEVRYRWTDSAVYTREGARSVKPGREAPGLTLIASYWQELDWGPGLRLIDARGAVLHEWAIHPEALFADSSDRDPQRNVALERRQIHGFHLFPDGDVLVNVEPVGTARLDPCGNVRWTLPAGSHHSIAPAADGTFWIPTRSFRTPVEELSRARSYPGLSGNVFEDRVARVSADGELLEEISMVRVLYRNDLERHLRKASRSVQLDPLHVNDVEPLFPEQAEAYPLFDAGDLLVSLRDLDLVLVFDPETLRVKWHSDHPFLQQHDPDFIGDGWIGVFDNNRDGTDRGTMLGGSRVVAVQPSTDSTRVLFPSERSEPLYTHIMGNWQLLANGNLLLTESMAGRIAEVSPEGTLVWEWMQRRFDDTRVPWVTGSKRYRLSEEYVASWPCSVRGASGAVPGRGRSEVEWQVES